MDTLRQRTSEKWRTYPADVLPMFVAEMDYPLAPPIQNALHKAIDRGDGGYVATHEMAAMHALAEFSSRAWGWQPSPDRIRTTTDVSVVIVESLRRLVDPGEAVIITPPVYPPFFDLIGEAGGVVEEVPLIDDGHTFTLDLEGIERALAKGARGLLLCNPHNPVGLVPSRDDLVDLADIVESHGGFVVSDEIHAPLTHHGHTFVPYLSVSDAARQHGIAAFSASKTFNVAGLKCAFFVTESERMASLVRSLPAEVTFRTGLLGVLAARAGFTHGREWLTNTISAIESNIDLLEHQLAQKLPSVRLRRPHASYLAWLDMTALGWGDDPAVTALREAKVALSPGPHFGTKGRGHARMNLACHPDTVVEAIDRLARAARAHPTPGHVAVHPDADVAPGKTAPRRIPTDRPLAAWAEAMYSLIVENLDALGRVAVELGDARINAVPPLPGANSPYAIVFHCVGMLRFWAGSVVGGEDIPRDRDAEFAATGTVDDLVLLLAEVSSRMRHWVEIAAREGVRDRSAVGSTRSSAVATASPEWMLTHVVRELSQHLGQLEVTRDLLMSGLD